MHGNTNKNDGYTPFLITPSNTEVGFKTAGGDPTAARAISFVTAGTLRIRTLDGDDVTIPNGALAAGQIHCIACNMVYATGTSASGIVGYV